MEHKDKKLKLDLDFLGEGVPEKSEKEKKNESKEQKSENVTPDTNTPMSDTAKWIWGAIAVAVLIIIIAASSESLSDTSTNNTDSIVPVVEKTKTANELCKENYGSNATYDSASNSCDCATGYYLGAISQKCVSFTTARDESCESSYPGTSFLKYDTTDNKNICDCKDGYDWNNDRTACYSITSFNQSCVSSYGTGSYSTTENGKRVCDCKYGSSWNNLRTMCVTTASINAICERDVGRNSRYYGTVTNGKYNCTEPY